VSDDLPKLPHPVRGALRDPVDDVAVQRMWRAIEAKRSGAPRARAISNVVYGALVLATVMVFLFQFRRPSPSGPVPVGPLVMDDGTPFVALSAGPNRLRDHSEVSLDPGARVDVLESSATSVVLFQRDGRATYDVAPGGPRRWSIECGLAVVEATDARLTVVVGTSTVRVDVERGAVLVRGERVEGRVRRLQAGEWLELPEEQAAPAPSPTAAPAPAPAPAPASAPASAEPSWRELANHGSYDPAYVVLGPGGIARAAAQDDSVDDLMALADVARLSGHPADAVQPLTRVVTGHAGDPRASLAAFTLGRIELDNLGQPAAAANAFAQAIALGLPGGLREDAQARLVEARARAGDRAGAQAAAADYERAFPHGTYLAKVQRWAAPRP
jgi:transmembrane sensor